MSINLKDYFCFGLIPLIRDDTERLRRDMSKKFKTDITNGQKPEFEHRIHIHLPKGDEHRDHITGEVC